MLFCELYHTERRCGCRNPFHQLTYRVWNDAESAAAPLPVCKLGMKQPERSGSGDVEAEKCLSQVKSEMIQRQIQCHCPLACKKFEDDEFDVNDIAKSSTKIQVYFQSLNLQRITQEAKYT
ncbi:unnamed protein product, partial [Cyprideis torosa]